MAQLRDCKQQKNQYTPHQSPLPESYPHPQNWKCCGQHGNHRILLKLYESKSLNTLEVVGVMRKFKGLLLTLTNPLGVILERTNK
jgi:hypothetical protein